MNKFDIMGKYLELSGVNKDIVNFITKNDYKFLKEFENLLGREVFLFTDKMSEQKFVEKLKKGAKNFKILDNGAIWYSTVSYPKMEFDKKTNFMKNDGISNFGTQYDEIKTNTYVSFENGQLIQRIVQHKMFEKDNKKCLDGEFVQQIMDLNKREIITNKAIYDNYAISYKDDFFVELPKEPLSTSTHIKDKFGFSRYVKSENVSYNNAIWDFVFNGNTKSQKNVQNLNNRRLTTAEKFKVTKDSIVKKITSKTQSELFEQLRSNSLDLLNNDSLDEIIHSNFTIDGKDAKNCTWTLERVTENSREIISQMDFKNNKQFIEQMLQPSIVDYAQSNPIIQGRIEQNDLGLSQYRAFSSMNNVITINNISSEYANYIANEVKKIEPVLYQKRMEQNDMQIQNESELGYQKINKKSGGFIDALLLSSVVGFVAGFLLFVMCVILKYHL